VILCTTCDRVFHGPSAVDETLTHLPEHHAAGAYPRLTGTDAP
jgi:hypothetical protein